MMINPRFPFVYSWTFKKTGSEKIVFNILILGNIVSSLFIVAAPENGSLNPAISH